MSAIFLVSLVVQTSLMGVDEFHFHWKRNLPKWERWGHPVDTLFFLMPISVLSFFKPTQSLRWVFGTLAVLSCLVITKDEWVHRQRSSALEQWIHAVLFLLHPVVLITAYFVWIETVFQFIWIWSLIFIFFLYQLTFWNIYADRIFKTRCDTDQ